MVPVHLGLKNGPFVPHNLITVQGIPITLLKFQITPRLKLLMSSGSRKWSPDIHVSVKPELHTSYTRDYWSAPLNEDVFEGYDVH
jgi:hypothetical protein